MSNEKETTLWDCWKILFTLLMVYYLVKRHGGHWILVPPVRRWGPTFIDRKGKFYTKRYLYPWYLWKIFVWKYECKIYHRFVRSPVPGYEKG